MASCTTCGCTSEFRDGECDSCQKDSCKHVCSGERVDDGRSEYYVCDGADSPRCPFHKKSSTCADCGDIPEDGIFHTFRGDSPLCDPCAEAAYGPPSPVDQRESIGRCAKCDLFYNLISSMDRRDLCNKCK